MIDVAVATAMLLSGLAAAAPAFQGIADSGETRLRAQHANRSIEVSIITSKRRAALTPDELDSTAPERRVVEKISITVNNREVYVPRSVIYGLVPPTEASLRAGTPLSVLTVHGGDASESYVVRIEFDRERVRRLIVASGLLPDKPTADHHVLFANTR